MKDQFVTYEIAKELKQLGFNEPCLGAFTNKKGDIVSGYAKVAPKGFMLAPLWQQVIDWLRDVHTTHIEIQSPDMPKDKWSFILHRPHSFGGCGEGNGFDTYSEARQRAVLKVIEILKNKKNEVFKSE